jgi:hypothetical protein
MNWILDNPGAAPISPFTAFSFPSSSSSSEPSAAITLNNRFPSQILSSFGPERFVIPDLSLAQVLCPHRDRDLNRLVPALSPTVPALSPTVPALSPTVPALSPTAGVPLLWPCSTAKTQIIVISCMISCCSSSGCSKLTSWLARLGWVHLFITAVAVCLFQSHRQFFRDTFVASLALYWSLSASGSKSHQRRDAPSRVSCLHVPHASRQAETNIIAL